MQQTPHRVRFDVSAESCVAVCSCGRRCVASTADRAARLMGPHLDVNLAAAAAAKTSRRLQFARAV